MTSKYECSRCHRTFVGAGETEGHEGADNAKDLRGEQGVHLARVGVGPQQLQTLAPGHEDLLGLAAGEVAVHRVRDARPPLQG